ncbi:MAG: 1-deoxy-D-xylulose-5-phosphate reductoisomerase [Planctomycetaceae bacterium]|nr:1-deoxy-D-xylulose-5-phosphate reductoisomerase [Planctomycetaceae bacterium]
MTRNKNITILGSTGSIGQSALEVVRHVEGLNVLAISGRSNLAKLVEQAIEFKPRYLVAADELMAENFTFPDLGETEVLVGEGQLDFIASLEEVDIVLAAIVGVAGLPSAWAAVEAGKTVALANKEALVVAGHLMTDSASRSGATILPVDSEHSAVFQALKAGSPDEVNRIVLTASGGPFRDLDANLMESVTVEQALAHPTWDMGQKISIDSATMMNKSLEVIEAKWLFGVPASQIEVVIHPQSIVHSLVEFVDGSTIAQMSPPDMMLPIQYAFTYPDRVAGPCPKLDLGQAMSLDFYPPDTTKFPALELGFEVAKFGGSTGAVLNAVNEEAVAAFLNHKIKFTDISTVCRNILDQHNFEPFPTMPQLIAADQWARQEISKWMNA